MRYRFGAYLIDTARRELRRASEPVQLAPQVFDLIVYLVEHRDRVVGKDDLVRAIWGGRAVSDAALTTRINAVRRALGDSGEQQWAIRTLPRKGLRFIADVIEIGDEGGSPIGRGPSAGPAILILPFASVGNAPQLAAMAIGATSEIITILSRSRWLPIIARHASVAGQPLDAVGAGKDAGARYVLDGLVRQSGNRMRITAQLIDVGSSAYLWAERFEDRIENAFDLQDAAAVAIAGAIEPTIEAAELRRSLPLREAELGPYELYLQALPGCYSYERRRLFGALHRLERAIDRHPSFARALAAAAGCRQFLAASGWADDPAANRAAAVELAHHALQMDGDDPAILTETGRVLAYFTEEIDPVIVERALRLNPGYACGWYWDGWLKLFTGQPDHAISSFQRAALLDPQHRPFLTGIGVAHFFGRRFADAIDALLASLQALPNWPTTYRFLTAAYAHSGMLDKARRAADRLQALTPAPAPQYVGVLPFRGRQDVALYLDGLDLAMRSQRPD